MRTDLSGVTIPRTATLRQAMQAIDDGRIGIAFVIDAAGRLVGTVTDGDARRALLGDGGLETPIADVMHRRFVAVTRQATESAIVDLMRVRSIKQIPVVDADQTLIGVHYQPDMTQAIGRPNWAVIMAGGEGRRLRPLTERVPKVMLPLGERPILEQLIELLVRHRFREVFISINYLGSQIVDYFGDGSAFDCRITYLREPRALGTAGALSLLPGLPTEPLLLLNGDLVTDIDLSALMDYHHEAACLGTQCVFEYVHQLPYGVVRLDVDQVVDQQEKPQYRELVNAGIYVLSPSLVELVPADRESTMPDLLAAARRHGYPVAAFPIRERWTDIGRLGDYERARDHWAARQGHGA
ncbi:MAG: nucleotidyltransferase family protein [Acidobacteria bacterium]|nr:nucleotidyltransferase family protein [Acidobacteriota bacterium]